MNKTSFLVKKGHKLNLSEKATKFTHVEVFLEAPALVRPEWIGFDEGAKVATIIDKPSHESIPFPIEIGQVIEFYSK